MQMAAVRRPEEPPMPEAVRAYVDHGFDGAPPRG